MGARKVATRARAVTVAVILSRILGLVREQVFAVLFGAGRSMDAFVVAYRIPNLLRDLFAEGALGMAFTKVFTEYKERHGKERAFSVASEVTTAFFVLILSVVILGELLAPLLVKLIAPEFFRFKEKFELTVLLTRIMWPFLLFISLSAMFAGMLNGLKVFFWPAFSSALFNLSSITLGVTFYFAAKSLGLYPIVGMALGVVLGGFLQTAFNFGLLTKRGFRYSIRWAPLSPPVKEVFRLLIPSVVGLSAMQINVFINTYFATSCGEGAVSWLSYAFRLMYVPIGLFGVALSVALLPEASKEVTRGNKDTLKKTFSSALLVSLSLSLPSAVGLSVLAEPVVRLLFEHGRFLPRDTLNTAAALKFFCLGLPAYGITKVSVPVFYSLGNTFFPASSSVLSVLVNLGIILVALPHLNFKAIALSTSGALMFQAIYLLVLLAFFLRGLPFQKLVLGTTKLLLEALAMGFLAVYLKNRLPVVLTILICGAFYLLLVRIFGPKEGLFFWSFRRSS